MPEHEKVNILMVDDQPAKLLSYEVILSGLGENLIKANSGREALEHLLKTDIAIVLMDVSMPELDGFELAEIIHQHPRYQQTAIIFISAVHLTDSDQIKGYAHGAVDYISVPIIPELLRAKVSVFAELYRKTRQLARLNAELEQRVAERTADLQRANEELTALNTELTRSNRELDDFAYIASHDLREPLRGIHNYSHFLMEDYGDKLGAEATEQLQTLVRLSQRMEALIDSLLHYSRLNRAEPTLVEVNLTDVMQDAMEMLKPRIDADNVQVRCPPVLPTCPWEWRATHGSHCQPVSATPSSITTKPRNGSKSVSVTWQCPVSRRSSLSATTASALPQSITTRSSKSSGGCTRRTSSAAALGWG